MNDIKIFIKFFHNCKKMMQLTLFADSNLYFSLRVVLYFRLEI